MLSGRTMPMGLICVDPGFDTGMSLIEVTAQWNKPELVKQATINYGKSGSGATGFYEKMCDWYEWCIQERGLASVDVVLEKFVPRPGKPVEYTALKVTGVLDHWWTAKANRMRSKFHEQIPVQGKFMVTNQVLLRAGVWVPGRANRHINDATRHGISYLVDQAHVGTCRAGFPEEE